jgi:hypothetical protein
LIVLGWSSEERGAALVVVGEWRDGVMEEGEERVGGSGERGRVGGGGER